MIDTLKKYVRGGGGGGGGSSGSDNSSSPALPSYDISPSGKNKGKVRNQTVPSKAPTLAEQVSPTASYGGPNDNPFDREVERSRENVLGGAGAGYNHTDKANQFIRNDPTASPDYYRNWINGGTPEDYANQHSARTTLDWDRQVEAFNNRRWWKPGIGQVGQISSGGITSSSGDESGRGERWEAIDTPELRAQQRREDYERDVVGKGIGRQDTYKRYPYELHAAQQKMQMAKNYDIDYAAGIANLQWGEVLRKAAAATGATGVYGRALWGLVGIGAYSMNDWDRKVMTMMENTLQNRSLTNGQMAEQMKEIFRYSAISTAEKMGVTVQTLLQKMIDLGYCSGDVLQGVFGGMWNTVRGAF